MFTRLTPILPVAQVAEELAFYEALGLTRHTDPEETYPLEDFAAVASGEHILFGLARTDDVAVPPAGLLWQLETDDLDAVARAAVDGGVQVTSAVATQPWGRRTMTLRSPNGYLVGVEEV
ncbi:VOC family protein [Auraticoccus monumenti]|uniref:Glyoxalase/fosfomycin resistance/dioxygenase domain-containing protein n=1 Tax=Auraticoccus monumenti TaxID=675864 RepID=A0A1G6UCB1_9ACTN|nr:VOC family protein [Auraticoccus monumenti]SDD38953.1 hypothetical protein SAMN04489747_0849 [Auraticoccus monumenti]